jgi:hypothetical protein
MDGSHLSRMYLAWTPRVEAAPRSRGVLIPVHLTVSLPCSLVNAISFDSNFKGRLCQLFMLNSIPQVEVILLEDRLLRLEQLIVNLDLIAHVLQFVPVVTMLSLQLRCVNGRPHVWRKPPVSFVFPVFFPISFLNLFLDCKLSTV